LTFSIKSFNKPRVVRFFAEYLDETAGLTQPAHLIGFGLRRRHGSFLTGFFQLVNDRIDTPSISGNLRTVALMNLFQQLFYQHDIDSPILDTRPQ
jgi:hypothetical protein